jgi:hypothetical protein
MSIYQDDVQDVECIIWNQELAKRKRIGKHVRKVILLKRKNNMYCIEEIYQNFLPGDLGPLYSATPEYATQFERLEDAQKFCDGYNEEHKDTWPKLNPHLMTDEDMKAWIAEQQYEHEMWDNYGI